MSILSPSKKQNPVSPVLNLELSQPSHLAYTDQVIAHLKKLSIYDLQSLMSLSNNLAEKTFEQIQVFSTSMQPKNIHPALLLYSGDAFLKLNAADFTSEDFEWAQSRLRVLSGLYGGLRPLDAIQPYRLDISTKVTLSPAENLVAFWRDKITKDLNKLELDYIVNLASIDYSKLLDKNRLKPPVVNISFMTLKDGSPRSIGLHAKQARGTLARYMIKNRIDTLEQLKQITLDQYTFAPELSSELEFCYIQ
jgi:hypothetical protein